MPPTASTATTEPTVDADGPGDAAHPITPPEPAGPPVPNPTVPAGPVGIAIPDGEPAAAALALLAALRPDAPSILAGRVESLTGQIDDAIEAARLDLRVTFAGFLADVSRKVKLRHALATRAGESPEPAAAGVLAAVRAVRRWRPAEEFRRERSTRIDRLRGELDLVEGRIRHLCGVLASGGNLEPPPGEHHQKTGLVHSHDGFLQRAEELLGARKGIADRLARLDAQGDPGRSSAVRSAIEAAGGVEAVAKAVAPSMTAQASEELDRVRRTMDDIAGQLDRLDPETRRAAELRQRMEQFQARVPDLQWTIGHQQKDAAGAMVAAAIAGSLPAVQALEAAVSGRLAELAAALNAIRGDDAALIAVVEELIG